MRVLVGNWFAEETTPRMLTIAEHTPQGPSAYCRFRIGVTPDNRKETFILVGKSHAKVEDIHSLIREEIDRWMKVKCKEFHIEGDWSHRSFIEQADPR